MNAISACYALHSPEIISPGISESSVPTTTFAAYLKGLKLVNAEQNVEIAEVALKWAEENPLFKLFSLIIKKFEEFEALSDGVDMLTREDWQKAFEGLFKTFEHNVAEISDSKKKFDDFTADIILIFTVYIDARDGKISEFEKFDAICEIISKRAENNAGTEGGKAFDQAMLELIIRFLEKFEPNVSWREWSTGQSALVTKGGEQQPVILIKAQLFVKELHVPNVQGEPAVSEKTADYLQKQGGLENTDAKTEIPKDVLKDITEYKYVKFATIDYANSDSVSQSLKEGLYARPVIHEKIAVDKVVNTESAVTPEVVGNGENAETASFAESVSGQKVAIQVSNSIVANLEKVITQAIKTAQVSEPAKVVQTTKAEVLAEVKSEFKVTLNPEHLGKVTVKLVTLQQAGDGIVRVAVQIIAASEQVRDLLMARASSVRVMIELSGVMVERYEVVTEQQQQAVSAANETGRDILDDEAEKNQRESSEKEQDDSESDEVEISFAELIQTMT